jgi:hypothetical protein
MSEHELTEAAVRALQARSFDRMAKEFRAAAGPALAAARTMAARRPPIDPLAEPTHTFRPGDPEPRR